MSCKYRLFAEVQQSKLPLRKRLYRLANEAPVYERRSVWKQILASLAGDCERIGDRDLENEVSRWKADSSYELISIVDDNYPEGFYQLDQPPLLLFVKSQETEPILRQDRSVAIVGSRKADQEGVGIARWFAKEISKAGGTVVSGLAYGADAAAHWGSLAGKGKFSTVAILGSGVQYIYPRGHERLAKRIVVSGGALLSEYPPESAPRKHHFLERNRLIAALTHSVVVIQAGKRSGALSTARHALELGRDVYVVPGSIRNPLYDGANELIRQGAIPISTPYGLVRELGLEPADSSTETPENKLHLQHKEILSYLATYGPTSSSVLKSNITDPEVLEVVLQELVVKEEVHRTWRGQYAIG